MSTKNHTSPLSEMCGIRRQMEQNLHGMGFFKIDDIANNDLKTLEERFGVMGNQLYHHAWGIDLSELGAPIMEGQVSYGKRANFISR